MPIWKSPAHEQLNQGVKKYVPDWLGDIIAPTSPEPSDFLAPISLGAGLAGPLVSIYKTAAERQAFTRKFLNDARLLGGGLKSKLYEGAKAFTEKYPRIAAHYKLGKVPQQLGTASARTMLPRGKVKSRIPVEFSYAGKQLSNLNEGIAKKLFHHEGTHVAQGLGNSDAEELYHAADRLFDYERNPFESTARFAGAKAEYPEMMGDRVGQTFNPNRLHAIKKLEDMLDEYDMTAPYHFQPDLFTSEKARTILANRKVRSSWKPRPDYAPEGGWAKYFPNYKGK